MSFDNMDAWLRVRTGILRREFVTKELIAQTLRQTTEPMPDDVRAYLADLLDGTIKRPPGRSRVVDVSRKSHSETLVEVICRATLGYVPDKDPERVLLAVTDYRRLMAVMKKRPLRNCANAMQAVEKAAERHDLDPDKLATHIHKLKKSTT